MLRLSAPYFRIWRLTGGEAVVLPEALFASGFESFLFVSPERSAADIPAATVADRAPHTARAYRRGLHGIGAGDRKQRREISRSRTVVGGNAPVFAPRAHP